ncbi:type IX secretion system anionic LPS delivery protein PorZ [Sediminibacterium sp.]|uniref:type IX secretion system anionic LPS delivery protein PorZ n=1 Tax=Sediminibacterium sp. TaxID=1917865 RepID=UPI003F6E472D
MRKQFYISFIAFILLGLALNGQWREHLSYQNTLQVIKGDKIYAATTAALFSIDNTLEINRYHKVNGLSDVGVQQIGWDSQTDQLIIAYKNSNIDILKGGITRNISDIQKSTISGNKTIQSIYSSGGTAFLCTGLGIILVNLSKYEIRDTWIIGNGGNQIGVNAFSEDNLYYYAATDEGIKRIRKLGVDPANYRNWESVAAPSSGKINTISIINNQLLITKNDSLFLQVNNQWKLLFQEPSFRVNHTGISNNKITICLRNQAGDSKVIILNTNGTIEKTISAPGIISFPTAALIDNSTIWVSDLFGGLSSFGSSVERFIPNGPIGVSSGEFAFYKGAVYQGAGAVNNAWNYLYNRDGLLVFKEGIWSNIGAFNTPILDSVFDIISLSIDPIDGSIWGGSYGGGLIKKNDNQIQIFKQNNSSLQAAIGDLGNIRVSGLALDQNNNLWISNYGAPQALKLKTKDNKWYGFTIPYNLTENAVAQIIADDYQQLWIQSPKGNGLIVYKHGNSIESTVDDQWKLFKQGAGNGNLPSNNILSILKDKDNNIWVGTDDGIGIINCANNPFSNCDATLPIIQQDQFAGLLFKGEQIQCMAVDGANQKWIGTQNGVWLLSADAKKILHHFTINNSPLLSNDIKKIGIDPITGEVYFATFNGLCSYRGVATEPKENLNSILVFPNPVPPQFNGQISIRGLTENTLIKITELNGRMLFQSRSLGGQVVWNGRDYLGNKIASGVYLVFARDEKGNENMVTKIVITSGR